MKKNLFTLALVTLIISILMSALPVFAAEKVVLPTTNWAYYKCDGTDLTYTDGKITGVANSATGSAIAPSITVNNGIGTNNVTFDETDKALKLNGYTDATYANSLKITTGVSGTNVMYNFTLAMTIRTTDDTWVVDSNNTTSYANLFDYGDFAAGNATNGGGISARLNKNDGTISLAVKKGNNTTSFTVTTNTSFKDTTTGKDKHPNDYHQLIFSFNNTRLTIWIDGARQQAAEGNSSANASFTMTGTDKNLYIGANKDGLAFGELSASNNGSFNGYIKDIYVYTVTTNSTPTATSMDKATPLKTLFSDLNVTTSGQTLTVASRIQNTDSSVATPTTNAQAPNVLYAAYDLNGKLLSATVFAVASKNSGQTGTPISTTLTLPDNTTAKLVKAFIWDTKDNLKPLVPFASTTLN